MTGTDCPRCHERAQRVGNAMDGCPEYLCGNAHLIHDPACTTVEPESRALHIGPVS